MLFILYDGRAKSGNIDEADALDTADTEQEARQSGLTMWEGMDAIWYENGEKPRWDLPPCKGK